MLKGKYVLVLFSIGLSMLGCELIVAIVHPQPTWNRLLADTPAMYVESDTLPFALRAGYKGKFVRREFNTGISINSMGLRNREFDSSNRDKFRILVLGDSFTFGHGVEQEEAYPAIVETLLQQRYGEGKIETINAGFASGYSPDTYYLYLKQTGLSLKPDLVLIGLFIGNDLDGYDQNEWVRTDQQGLPVQIVDNISLVDQQGYYVFRKRSFAYSIPILRNSHLFHLTGAAFRSAQHFFSPQQFYPGIYRREYRSETIAKMEQTEKLLVALTATAISAGARVAVIMIPTREQVYPSRYPSYADADLDKPQRLLAEFFRQQSIEYLDLLPAMQAKGRQAEFYFGVDIHWNALGHSQAADQIGEYLIARDLLGYPPSRWAPAR